MNTLKQLFEEYRQRVLIPNGRDNEDQRNGFFAGAISGIHEAYTNGVDREQFNAEVMSLQLTMDPETKN